MTIVGKGVDAYLKANPKELNRFAELDFNNSGLYAGQDSYYTRGLFKKQRRLIKTRGSRSSYWAERAMLVGSTPRERSIRLLELLWLSSRSGSRGS